MILSKRYINSFRVFLSQVLRPFSYLFIKHDYKWQMDWLLPGLLTLVSGAVLYVLVGQANLYGDSGIIARVLGFIQNLPGFYIAALAAIATFGRNDIDSILPQPTPTISEVRNGQKSTIPLTRRRFLCMMFAFLTAECVVLVLVSIGLLSVAGHLSAGHALASLWISKAVFLVYLFFLYQMILATFWGLFYLGDRIHQA